MGYALRRLEELDRQIADYDRDIRDAAELTSLMMENRRILMNVRNIVLIRVDAMLRDAIARRVASSAARAEASETERRAKEEAEQKAKAEAERKDNEEKTHAKAVTRKRSRSHDRNEAG